MIALPNPQDNQRTKRGWRVAANVAFLHPTDLESFHDRNIEEVSIRSLGDEVDAMICQLGRALPYDSDYAA